jgi:hypothetical protein
VPFAADRILTNEVALSGDSTRQARNIVIWQERRSADGVRGREVPGGVVNKVRAA